MQGEEHELADVLDAVVHSNHGGRVAWAMARFEMGCGRRLESEALSDYLLALRALLDAGPEGERSAGLALRVAVLCAEEAERKGVQRRVELAQALERFVIGDGAGDDYLDAVGADSPRTLVAELERHLRALLRDVLCGYLDSDLARVADDMLLETSEPQEMRAPEVGAGAQARGGGPGHVVDRRRTGAPRGPGLLVGAGLASAARLLRTGARPSRRARRGRARRRPARAPPPAACGPCACAGRSRLWASRSARRALLLEVAAPPCRPVRASSTLPSSVCSRPPPAPFTGSRTRLATTPPNGRSSAASLRAK